MRKLLLDGGDASGIVTFDNILYFSGKLKASLFDYLACLDHVDGDIVIDECKYIEIESINVTFHLQYILLSHNLGAGILDYSNGAVHFIESEMFVPFAAAGVAAPKDGVLSDLAVAVGDNVRSGQVLFVVK